MTDRIMSAPRNNDIRFAPPVSFGAWKRDEDTLQIFITLLHKPLNYVIFRRAGRKQMKNEAEPRWGLLEDGARRNLAKNRNGCPASSKARNNRLNILRAVSK